MGVDVGVAVGVLVGVDVGVLVGGGPSSSTMIRLAALALKLASFM